MDSVPINSSPDAEPPSTIPISSSPAAILQNVPASSSPATPPLAINPVAPPFVPKGMELLSVPQSELPSDVITSAAVRLKSNTLLMTCQVLVCAPDGTRVEARTLLDNGSSASFVSEHLAQTLQLPRTSQRARMIEVLIRFRMHRIALVADISKMYRSVELPPSDRDLYLRMEKQSRRHPPRFQDDEGHVYWCIFVIFRGKYGS